MFLYNNHNSSVNNLAMALFIFKILRVYHNRKDNNANLISDSNVQSSPKVNAGKIQKII